MSVELTFSKASGFGPGAMIMTMDGELPVEWLESGDRLITRDHGAQPILAIKRSRGIGPDGLPLLPPLHLRPRENAATEGLQEPLRLSPHHQVLVSSPHVALNLGKHEAMAEIGALSRRIAPRPDPNAPAISYHHIIMEHHELILTCGIWAETTGLETAAMLSVPPEIRRTSKVFAEDAKAPRMCLNRVESKMIRDLLDPEETLLHLLAA
ncbi:Hint domain-containing protein [Sulfitobacter sp.]|uniref:Hint domain-containing protein n=1 Tax=Sulfitobacter sp. TaxID=1903071 RepID=UPI0035633DA7